MARKIDITKLVTDEGNVRKHSARNLEAIRNSLQAFGQVKPIVVVEEGDGFVVIAGNGTLDAAKALGWKKLDAVVFDGTAEQARAYAIADNRTAELADWDVEPLLKQLEQFDANTLQATGFSQVDFDDLMKAFGAPPDLDALAEQIGDPFGDGLVRISFRVPEHVAEKWKAAVLATGIKDADEAASKVLQSIQ